MFDKSIFYKRYICFFIEIAITKNNLLAVIPEWGPNYKITFELNVESFANGGNLWGNIFRFTATDVDCCNVGDRIPALFTNSGDFLYLCTNIDDNGDKWCYHQSALLKLIHGTLLSMNKNLLNTR